MYPPFYLGVTEWAYARTDLTASEQALLLAIAYHANASTKVAEPSKATLQKLSKLKDKAYKAAAIGLEAKGLLKIHQRPKKGEKNDTNLYHLLLDCALVDPQGEGVQKTPHWGSKGHPEIPITNTIDINKDLGGPKDTPIPPIPGGTNVTPPSEVHPSGSVTSTAVLSSDLPMWIYQLAAELSYDLADQMIASGHKKQRFRNDAVAWSQDLAYLLGAKLGVAAQLVGKDEGDLTDLFREAIAHAGEYVDFRRCGPTITPVKLLSYRFEEVLGRVAKVAPPEPEADAYLLDAEEIAANKARANEMLAALRGAFSLFQHHSSLWYREDNYMNGAEKVQGVSRA